jgi:hypothetical protein
MAKVVLNGQAVDTTAKGATVKVAGKDLELTLVYVGADEAGQSWTWEPYKGIKAETVKAGNKVATTLSAAGKTIFTNLTAQSVFEVIHAKYGQSKATTDSLYKKANPGRKESKQGTQAKIVITEQGNW